MARTPAMNDKRRKPTDDEVHIKRRKLASLIGQLSTRTHVLNSRPASVFLEVCVEGSMDYIVCRHAQLFSSLEDLQIGCSYKFVNLRSNVLKLKSGSVQCFNLQKDSVWSEVDDLHSVNPPSCFEKFSNIQGTVDAIDHELGICYLNDSIMVIFSTCSRIALVPVLKEGQTITVFNAHRLDTPNGKVAYALCVKSFIRVVGDHNKSHKLNLSPLQLILGDTIRDYRLILWLQECSDHLLKSLSDDFLTSLGLSSSKCVEIRRSLLQEMAKFALDLDTVEKRSFVEEFFSRDHNLCCGTLKNDFVPIVLSDISELNQEYPVLEDEPDEDFSWQYSVKNCLKMFLVGMLNFKYANYRLTFSNSCGSIPCVITPKDGQPIDGKELAKLNGSIVLVPNLDFVRERFSWQDISGEQFNQNWRYFAFRIDQIRVLSPLSMNQENFIYPMKEAPLQNYLSQYVFVQTKTSTSIQKRGKPAQCHLLVTVLGDMVHVSSSQTPVERGIHSHPVFVTLEGPLLAAHPLISVNSVYEFRFPLNFDKDFFKNGSLIFAIEGLKSLLPTTSCVGLPKFCNICFVSNYPVPRNVVRNYLGIKQALKEANTHELINLSGYVVSRYHQKPRFAREMVSTGVNGFGVADTRVLAVVLQEESGECQTNPLATVYLSNWCTLQYPLALLPHSKVGITFVRKVCPKNSAQTSAPYFRASILSSVEILDIPKEEFSDEGKVIKSIMGPRSLLPTILSEATFGCNWMSVSMAHLLKLTITASCASCKHPFQNGSCSFVGCEATLNPTYSYHACLKVSEFTSSCIVVVSSSAVEKLFLDSEEIKKSILRLVDSCGQLSYQYPGLCEDQSLEQRVFRICCMSLLEGKRFHMLCRSFHSKQDLENSVDRILYAVDILPITSWHMASASALF